MTDSADDSANPDAAVIAFVRLVQKELDAAPKDGGEIELLRSCLDLMLTYMSETRPTLTHALERAQKASLTSGLLDELMGAGAKIDADRMSTVSGIGELGAAGGDGAQVLRRMIAGVEYMNDAARALTKRIDRLLEECGSRSV
jgi:hypothetical protein